MKEFVDYVVKALVDHPELVQVVEHERAGATVIELRVDASDIGKVIGKQGRTSAALRSLLMVAAGKSGRRVVLDIVEPEGGPREGEANAHQAEDREP